MNRKRIEKILHNCSKTIDESVNMVGASNEIVKYIEDLEQQVEKQQEVINKAIGYIQENTCWELRTSKVLDILKEVE